VLLPVVVINLRYLQSVKKPVEPALENVGSQSFQGAENAFALQELTLNACSYWVKKTLQMTKQGIA